MASDKTLPLSLCLGLNDSNKNPRLFPVALLYVSARFSARLLRSALSNSGILVFHSTIPFQWNSLVIHIAYAVIG